MNYWQVDLSKSLKICPQKILVSQRELYTLNLDHPTLNIITSTPLNSDLKWPSNFI